MGIDKEEACFNLPKVTKCVDFVVYPTLMIKTYQEWWIKSLKPTRGLSDLQNPLVAHEVLDTPPMGFKDMILPSW